VGDYEPGDGGTDLAASDYGVYADTLSDGSWSVDVLPLPAEAFNGQLNAVSCVSLTACVAVGSDLVGMGSPLQYPVGANALLVEVLSGTTWTSTTIPVTPGADADFVGLNSVSCTSVTSCVAVGSDGQNAIIETLSGVTWTQSVAPLPAAPTPPYAEMMSVTCQSTTSCVAVGLYGANFMADTLSGTTWNPTELPLPPGWRQANFVRSAEPLPLSCPTSTWCVVTIVVGANHTDQITQVTDTLAGTTWTTAFNPAPAGTLFTSVSCWVPEACVAVGGLPPDGNPAVGYILSGASWIATSFPTLSDGYAEVAAVSCDTEATCVAVGGTGNALQPTPLAFLLTGTTWTDSTIPIPSPTPYALLSAVSCDAPQTCVSTGTTSDQIPSVAPSSPVPIVENLSEGSVSTIFPPLPPGAVENSNFLIGEQPLQAISCPSAQFCVAVGSYKPTATTWLPAAEVFSDGVWHAVALPIPAHFESGLFTVMTGVSCASTTSCVAVGIDHSGDLLVERLSGNVWHPIVIPATGAAAAKYMEAISCTTSSSCVAVGTFVGSAGSYGAAVTISGDRWTARRLPLPYNGIGIQPLVGLGSIWCQSSSSCVAVGSYGGVASHASIPFADVLSNGKWYATTLPTPPAPDQQSFLNSVSCTSVTLCVAVGSSDGAPLIDSLSGTTWTTTPAVMPAPDTNVVLQSVSCPAPGSCDAVGVGTGPSGTYPVVAQLGS